tara:strand:+ start:1451 stop:2353 length:903 start_codon:yes stop_codon:yes gene_type:complete
METTLLFKTTLILTFELGIAFGLCIYFLKAAKKLALSGKPFLGIHFRHSVNMNNEIDLIPDASKAIDYPRKLTKFEVEKKTQGIFSRQKNEIKRKVEFAKNREEAIAYLKEGYRDDLYMPRPIFIISILWFLLSLGLLISSTVPPYEYYLHVGMTLFTLTNICLGPLLGWIMLMIDENDGMRALKITLIITFIAGFIGYSDFYSFAQNGYLTTIMGISLFGLVVFSFINLFRGFSRGVTRNVAIGGAILFTLYIIVDFNRLIYLENLNVNDWNTAFYMSYTIYLDIINLLLDILEAMGNS